MTVSVVLLVAIVIFLIGIGIVVAKEEYKSGQVWIISAAVFYYLFNGVI